MSASCRCELCASVFSKASIPFRAEHDIVEGRGPVKLSPKWKYTEQLPVRFIFHSMLYAASASSSDEQNRASVHIGFEQAKLLLPGSLCTANNNKALNFEAMSPKGPLPLFIQNNSVASELSGAQYQISCVAITDINQPLY